ncbi:MAG: ATP synthase subunit I [Pyrinomonadaceae bacterium]
MATRANYSTENTVSGDAALNQRMQLVMVIVTVVASGVAPFAAPWRVATGLLLGGALSLLNYRWLHQSTAAVIALNAGGQISRMRLAQYAFRYAVIAGIVVVAAELKLAYLSALIIGLGSFVVAIFFEALRVFYLAFIHGEEMS